MITTIIGVFLFLCMEYSCCFERRASFDGKISSSSDLPLRSRSQIQPLAQLNLSSCEDRSFDFYSHWQKIHTQQVNPETFIILNEKPVSYRPCHDYDSLHDAAIADDTIALEKMLLSERHRDQLDSYNMNGQTPLQAAVEFSSDRAILFLVKKGAQIHIKNKNNEYSAVTLAHAYSKLSACLNVVPLMTLQQAVLQTTGQVLVVKDAKKMKRAREEKEVPFAKPSRIIRLKRQAPKRESTPEYQALPQEEEYDPYLLNV